MTTIIKIFAIALIFTALGYFWCFKTYEPLKLAQENHELRVDVRACNRAWVKEFSKKKGLIEVKK